MAVADINKWISGETEVFFLPNEPLSVTVDCNPGKEGSTASPARRKFVFRAIAAIVATFALVVFSRSIRKPGRASRRLHAGCRSGSIRASPELIPEEGSPPGSDIA